MKSFLCIILGMIFFGALGAFVAWHTPIGM